MLKVLIGTRWICLIMVLCSVLGALLMFIVGAVHTVEAFGLYFGFLESHIAGGQKLIGVDAFVQLVSSWDSFLFGLVFFICPRLLTSSHFGILVSGDPSFSNDQPHKRFYSFC